MTVYNVLNILDRMFTVGTNSFSEYVKWTSDDNGFLRTCFCKKNFVLKDRCIPRNITHLVIGCETEFNKDDLICKWVDEPFEFESTVLKMQICFTTDGCIEDEVEWNYSMGYRYCYIIDLETESVIDTLVEGHVN